MKLNAWIGFLATANAASVSLELYSQWVGAPFDVQLIEAVAAVNDSLYLTSALTLYSDHLLDSDPDSDTEADDWYQGSLALDLGRYQKISQRLTPAQLGLANLNLVNHIWSPRIQMHYDHYEGEVKSREKSLLKKCTKDSFGEILDDPMGAWVKYGSKVYCSEQDLYALQTDATSEPVYAFDRIVGQNDAAPLLALYGDPTCDRFGAMFSTLYQLAEQGNLRFVWRYVPRDSYSNMPLTGYGKTLLIKEKKKGKVPSLGTLSQILEVAQKSPIYEYEDDKLPSISLNLAALVMGMPEPNRLALLADALYNLPRYAPYLANIKAPTNLGEVKSSAMANEKKGASRDMMGLSVNGAPVHRLETDLSHVISKIRRELEHMEAMTGFGFSPAEAKLLLSKFALFSAVKETEFRQGSVHNRFSLYKDVFDSGNPKLGGVVFFNDIEVNPNYKHYSTDRYEVYVDNAFRLQKGQVPPLKENVHDVIFVMNFSNKNQLKVFFAMSKIILDKGIAQQLGVLPLIASDKDDEIARRFYHILEVGEQNEALAFLYKYYESTSESESELLELVSITGDVQYPQYNKTIGKFDLTEASVVINGIILDMRSPTWQSQMVNQIAHDVTRLKGHIQEGLDRGVQLKHLLYEGSKSERNTRLIPKDPGNIRYKLVTPKMIDNSVAFKKLVNENQPSVNFWIMGDLNSRMLLEQLKEIFKFMRQYNGRSSQVRVFNTAENSGLMQELIAKYSLIRLTSLKLREMSRMIGDVSIQSLTPRNDTKISILEEHEIQTHQPGLLFNSRYLRLDRIYTVRNLEVLLEYENSQRLGILDEICSSYPFQLQDNSIMDFRSDAFPYDSLDWYDLLTSRITCAFNAEDSLVRTDVSRFDFSSLDYTNSIDVNPADSNKLLDVLVAIDPTDEFSQKLLAITLSIQDLDFINVRILLQPLSQVDDPAPLDRLYVSQFVSLTPRFSSAGEYQAPRCIKFEFLPECAVVADLDVPLSWQYVRSSGTDHVDLDLLRISEDDDIHANFTLVRLIVETFVKDVQTGSSVTGLELQACKGAVTREGYTLNALGYNQMQLEPGLWRISLAQDSTSEELFELLSLDQNKYMANDAALGAVEVPIFSIFPSVYNARIRHKPQDEVAAVVSKERPKAHRKAKRGDINIFSIARGQSYEKLMAIMMLSVKKYASKRVTFWLLQDYLSKTMQDQLPVLAAEVGFEYELVSYKWPVWLRQQREPIRTVWGFKILFLDVLFPADLDRIIFIDADQVARADVAELMSIDMNGTAYGFTPMCETRRDMEGFMFWKQGYWKNVLKDDLKYHISALFVVDLEAFRQQGVGEKLRSHYQKLSSDAGSLSNLDQDLPNNLQRVVPIFSLPPEWLWCETWCSSEQKSTAKMIDMCNDPSSSEGKLEKARRIIPEWDDYNKRLQQFGQGELEIEHDEL